jgi:mono/diheme cytochrome c family protein
LVFARPDAGIGRMGPYRAPVNPGGGAATADPAPGGDAPAPVPSAASDADISAAGQRVYTASCASCHGADLAGAGGIPPLSGPAFVANWRTRPAAELLAKVRTMPPGAAGSLPDADYRAGTARLLQTNALAAR